MRSMSQRKGGSASGAVSTPNPLNRAVPPPVPAGSHEMTAQGGRNGQPAPASGAGAGAGAGGRGGASPTSPSLRSMRSIRKASALKTFSSLKAVQTGLHIAGVDPRNGAQLKATLAQAGNQLSGFVKGEHVAAVSTSYEDLLTHMLQPNERVVVRPLDFSVIELTDGSGEDKRKGPGQLMITNQRLLLLTCKPATTGSVEKVGGSRENSVWEASYGFHDAVWFSAIPLKKFKVTRLAPLCAGHRVGSHPRALSAPCGSHGCVVRDARRWSWTWKPRCWPSSWWRGPRRAAARRCAAGPSAGSPSAPWHPSSATRAASSCGTCGHRGADKRA